jgi:hypothetical protein
MLSKIIELIRNKHVLSLAGNIIMSGLGMLTTAIIYRSLTLEEVGIWVIFQTTILFVDTFRSGFLNHRFYKILCRLIKRAGGRSGGFYLVYCFGYYGRVYFTEPAGTVLFKYAAR